MNFKYTVSCRPVDYYGANKDKVAEIHIQDETGVHLVQAVSLHMLKYKSIADLMWKDIRAKFENYLEIKTDE